MKKFIKYFFSKLGIDIRRLSASSNQSYQTVKFLENFEIDLIFDVGANKGQFSQSIRSFGYKGKIVSFEPIPEAHEKLSALASREKLWSVHERCAIGEYDGVVKFNVSKNSVSSSVLPILDEHIVAANSSIYVDAINVPIFRLDTISNGYLSDKNRLFIKIDTQGFEWNVLTGSEETLKNTVGVLCELSLVPLYENQRLWLDVIDRLKGYGFNVWCIQTGFTNNNSGRTLQVDVLFFKNLS